MGIKDQIYKLKENWLLVVLVLLVLFVSTFGGGVKSLGSIADERFYAAAQSVPEALSAGHDRGYYPSGDFAPEVETRIITKTAYLESEVEKGEFSDAIARLKSIITTTDSFILNENVNTHGEGRASYKQGYYQLRVETSKYDAIITQLRDLGEVTSFSENTNDVTGLYVNTRDQLELEKSRLARYQQMYAEAKDINDKIQLNDRIFEQERMIKFLEERLESTEQRVEYTTISFTLQEKQSKYVNIALIRISELVRKLVGSVNSLLSLIFVVLPYAFVALLTWLGIRWVRNR